MRTRDNFENDPLILEAIDRNLGDTRDRFLSYTNGSVRLKGKTVELSGETEASLGAQFEITN